jgi:transaldolase/glucose-6-phosphate isomerase
MTSSNIPSNYVQFGQSLWYDNIQRSLIKSGELEAMINRGDIRGVTSNPTIFQNAIGKSSDYDDAIQTMSWAGLDAETIFYELAIQDIRSAADLFAPLYTSSNKRDGYVSLEVSPYLAGDTQKTIAEAKRLWQKVDRPNLMIKIPATLEGIPAIKEVIASGINVNVTLIFSIERYRQVLEAFLQGIESRVNQNLPIDGIASVASFFVSRVDTKIDGLLKTKIKAGENTKEMESLLGKAAVANAAVAYSIFEELMSQPRVKSLLKADCQMQRPLWASTSTKNPEYPDLLYVDTLIAPYTVNTVPPQTLEAIRNHGNPSNLSIREAQLTTKEIFSKIEEAGISFEKVTSELEEEGVKSFANSFTSLLETINDRKSGFLDELGELQPFVIDKLKKMTSESVISRMFEKDPTVWTKNVAEHAEIKNRLGWLNSPVNSEKLLDEIGSFVMQTRSKGYTDLVLLGMGGSSMAPEVFSLVGKSFNILESGMKLTVLDTTDPRQIIDAARRINPLNALYIVASKSGSTSEIDALLSYFWHLTKSILGDTSGDHFIAITDPGTFLEKIAIERNFSHIFHGDPSVGGRYSALTPFGLVPAALLGLDLTKLLNNANSARFAALPDAPVSQNRSAILGTILGEAALHGRNKITILSDPEFSSLGAWIEQLVAESSGKTGIGILPIDNEPIMPPEYYLPDRVFVYFCHSGNFREIVTNLKNAGQPVLTFFIPDGYALGSEMYTWEYATAVACSIIGVNAFNQPDVQDSKTRTQDKIKAFIQNGSLLESTPSWQNDEYAIFPTNCDLSKSDSIEDYIKAFLKLATPSDYIAINAYVPRDSYFSELLQDFRKQIMQLTGCATTLGFGPRFLHSTGQIHKGGPANCLFIQITMDYSSHDLKIPDKQFSFGMLQAAQAQGDFEALQNRNRRIFRIHLKNNMNIKLPHINLK